MSPNMGIGMVFWGMVAGAGLAGMMYHAKAPVLMKPQEAKQATPPTVFKQVGDCTVYKDIDAGKTIYYSVCPANATPAKEAK